MDAQKDQIDDLKKRVQLLEKEVNTLKLKDVWRSHHIENLYRLVDGNSQYSRKNNLIFDGLFIPKGANDSEIRQLVIAEIRRAKLDVEDHQVDRAHRIERPYRDGSGNLHIPIIVRFTGWHARNVVYEARRSLKAFVRADLTARRQSMLSEIKNMIDDSESRASQLVAYAFVDRNCYITLKSKDDRYFKLSGMKNELDTLLNFIEDTQQPHVHTWGRIDEDMAELVAKSTVPATVEKGVPRIVNLNKIDDIQAWLSDDNHVYCGRRHGDIEESRWHNPFKLSANSLEASLQMYEAHVTSDDELVRDLGSLKGKILACWCTDQSQCHCSILLKLIG